MKKNILLLVCLIILGSILSLTNYKRINKTSLNYKENQNQTTTYTDNLSKLIEIKYQAVATAHTVAALELAKSHFKYHYPELEVNNIESAFYTIPIFGITPKNPNQISLLYFVIPITATTKNKTLTAEFKVIITDNKNSQLKLAAIMPNSLITDLKNHSPNCELIYRQKTNSWYKWCFNGINLVAGDNNPLINSSKFSNLSAYINYENNNL